MNTDISSMYSPPRPWWERTAAQMCAWGIGAVLAVLWLGIAVGYCLIEAARFCACPGAARRMLREMKEQA